MEEFSFQKKSIIMLPTIHFIQRGTIIKLMFQLNKLLQNLLKIIICVHLSRITPFSKIPNVVQLQGMYQFINQATQ